MATLLAHVTYIGNRGKCTVKHWRSGLNQAFTMVLLLGSILEVKVLWGLLW